MGFPANMRTLIVQWTKADIQGCVIHGYIDRRSTCMGVWQIIFFSVYNHVMFNSAYNSLVRNYHETLSKSVFSPHCGVTLMNIECDINKQCACKWLN